MAMTEIKCSQCGKHLFDTDKKEISAIFEARNKGIMASFPVLYGKHSPVFFCGKDCKKKWFTDNTTEEQRESAGKFIRELKADKPRIVNEICGKLSMLQAIYKEVRRNKRIK